MVKYNIYCGTVAAILSDFFYNTGLTRPHPSPPPTPPPSPHTHRQKNISNVFHTWEYRIIFYLLWMLHRVTSDD